MSIAKVFCEVDDAGNPIRIIAKPQDIWKLPCEKVRQFPKAFAVGAIREAVFLRADGECEDCGRRITSLNGEMHEKIPKGNGGEVSLANSTAICFFCHTGRPDSAHGNRRFQSSKI